MQHASLHSYLTVLLKYIDLFQWTHIKLLNFGRFFIHKMLAYGSEMDGKIILCVMLKIVPISLPQSSQISTSAYY